MDEFTPDLFIEEFLKNLGWADPTPEQIKEVNAALSKMEPIECPCCQRPIE
jgi:hypothetical protein